mgnify:CR=1 FL=1
MDNHGELEVDEDRLHAADPDGLYLYYVGGLPLHDDARPGGGVHRRDEPGSAQAARSRRDAGRPHRHTLARAEAGAAQLPLQRSPHDMRRRFLWAGSRTTGPTTSTRHGRRGCRAAGQRSPVDRLRTHHQGAPGVPTLLRRKGKAHAHRLRPQQEGRPQIAGPGVRGREERRAREQARRAREREAEDGRPEPGSCATPLGETSIATSAPAATDPSRPRRSETNGRLRST